MTESRRGKSQRLLKTLSGGMFVQRSAL
ncbi:hypothetical protein MY8738_008646 [Beauveria namnaoensis]